MARRSVVTHEEPTTFPTDPSDELPVGLQLSWRLRALIATGECRSGERLPSLRRLAESAGVNVNTVRAVYESLGEQGLIRRHHGQGTFVADGVGHPPGWGRSPARHCERPVRRGSARASSRSWP